MINGYSTKFLSSGSTLWIFLLALGMRALALHHTDPVAFDSGRYFEMAEFLRAGQWAGVLSHDYPPLFPILIAALQWFGLSAEASGLLVSLTFDLLVIFPLLAIARAVAGQAAWGAAFLWAIHPYAVRLGVRALSDAPTALFVALAIWLGLRAHERGKLAWALGAGVISGLAYLTRPEGIEPALVLAAFYALWWDSPTRHDDGQPQAQTSRRFAPQPIARVPWIMAPLVGWAIIAAPYVTYISIEAGTLTLSKKKSATAMVHSLTSGDPAGNRIRQPDALSETTGQGKGGGQRDKEKNPKSIVSTRPGKVSEQPTNVAQAEPRSWLSRISQNVYIFQKPLVNGIHPLVLILGFISIWVFRSRKFVANSWASKLLLGLMGLHFLVMVGVAADKGPDYLGGHHFFLMVLYMLPFSGAGLTGILNWIRKRSPIPQWGPWLAMILLVASSVPKLLRGPGKESVIRPAAEWIREQAYERPVVITPIAKLTYHAQAERVPMDGNYDRIVRTAHARGAQLVAFYPKKKDPDLQAHIESGDLELAAEFSRRSKKKLYHFQIYRFLTPHTTPKKSKR